MFGSLIIVNVIFRVHFPSRAIFPTNWSWMYDRIHEGRGWVKPKFYTNVDEFISVVCQLELFLREGIVRCPCSKCRCRNYLDIETIRYHLYKDGFGPDYWVWTEYGEVVTQDV